MKILRLKPRPAPLPPIPRERTDSDFIESTADISCLNELIVAQERSALSSTDDMNTLEASEERRAAAEAQAMQQNH